MTLSRVVLVAWFAGLSLGLACKNSGSGSDAPGQVTAVEGSSACPRSLPANGASCPRGETDFCVYRTTTRDFACACGRGQWTCAGK